MTFKVPDLAAAIDTARRAGYSPIGIDLSHDEWKEAFLHPHRATGVVVQLAQAAHGWDSPPPEGFPTTRRTPPASLVRITHAVADLDGALALFAGLLGGSTGARIAGPGGTWEGVDLTWPGPPGLRLVAPTDQGDAGIDDLRSWIGGLSGRVHHLAFSVADAVHQERAVAGGGTIPGVLAAEHVGAVVDPDDNFGTRLVLLNV